jgi:chemotaxis protein CheX
LEKAGQQLKVELISPFVEGAKETFNIMANTKIRRKDLYIKTGFQMFGDVSGVIGLSGTTAGTCAISLPETFARKVVRQILGLEQDANLPDSDMRDGIGEMINMIAGCAKASLAGSQYKFNLTLPTIISGGKHEFFQRTGTYCVVILFETADKEEFTLDVCVAKR